MCIRDRYQRRVRGFVTSAMSNRLAHGIGRLSDMVMTKGSGSWIWTKDGRKLLDFSTGIGVVNTGHCHPHVVAAAQKQCETLVHGQVNIGYHDRMLELCEKLVPTLPEGHDRLFFWNSGAEAVEAAVKLARHATGKPGIMVFKGGYHGRTIGTMAMTTSKNIFRDGFGPLMGGVSVAPFPEVPAYFDLSDDSHVGGDYAMSAACALEGVEFLLQTETSARETAAMVVEPFQGEGGYVAPPREFITGLRKICDDNGILLVADEVQTGFGRTGKHLAMEHYGVRPDITVMAKGLASGFPLSCISSSTELFSTQQPGSMGGTYAGNAVACAAAIATQEVIQEEKLVQRSAELGVQLRSWLKVLAADPANQIRDVRGSGLFVGVEYNRDAKGIAAQVSQACLAEGMILLSTGIKETTRFIPPLTVSQQELELGFEHYKNALKKVIAARQ
eukprot:TRINITY_DN4275_c0_g1_i1.p1 TRINITY_DN4275_c0_g1~~TRINITY_DN4275_c0_g1_i1.p1  ORF type:complete len:445 (+),score=142.20 TRINITY_DN4275_c0_g1_i1:150-1484(+)